MNYITEIKSFYDWLETNSISTSAIALWHALLHINNKAGWITEFAVAQSVLCSKTGLKATMFKNARNQLQQTGRISFKSRAGSQSAIYVIHPFNKDLWSQCDHNSDHITDHNSGHNGDHVSDPLNKLNKTKLNKKEKVKKEKFDLQICLSEYAQADKSLLAALVAFAEMRAKSKYPLTEGAVKVLLKELDKHGSTNAEKVMMLERSILNGYRGVFPLQKNASQAAPGSEWAAQVTKEKKRRAKADCPKCKGSGFYQGERDGRPWMFECECRRADSDFYL